MKFSLICASVASAHQLVDSSYGVRWSNKDLYEINMIQPGPIQSNPDLVDPVRQAHTDSVIDMVKKAHFATDVHDSYQEWNDSYLDSKYRRGDSEY